MVFSGPDFERRATNESYVNYVYWHPNSPPGHGLPTRSRRQVSVQCPALGLSYNCETIRTYSLSKRSRRVGWFLFVFYWIASAVSSNSSCLVISTYRNRNRENALPSYIIDLVSTYPTPIDIAYSYRFTAQVDSNVSLVASHMNCLPMSRPTSSGIVSGIVPSICLETGHFWHSQCHAMGIAPGCIVWVYYLINIFYIFVVTVISFRYLGKYYFSERASMYDLLSLVHLDLILTILSSRVRDIMGMCVGFSSVCSSYS